MAADFIESNGWLAQFGGRTLGPGTAKNLLDAFQAGGLTREAEVKHDQFTGGAWKPITDFPALIGEEEKPAPGATTKDPFKAGPPPAAEPKVDAEGNAEVKVVSPEIPDEEAPKAWEKAEKVVEATILPDEPVPAPAAKSQVAPAEPNPAAPKSASVAARPSSAPASGPPAGQAQNLPDAAATAQGAARPSSAPAPGPQQARPSSAPSGPPVEAAPAKPAEKAPPAEKKKVGAPAFVRPSAKTSANPAPSASEEAAPAARSTESPFGQSKPAAEPKAPQQQPAGIMPEQPPASAPPKTERERPPVGPVKSLNKPFGAAPAPKPAATPEPPSTEEKSVSKESPFTTGTAAAASAAAPAPAAPAQAQPAPAAAAAPGGSSPAPTPRKKGSKLPLVATITVLLAGGGAAGWYFLMGPGAKPAEVVSHSPVPTAPPVAPTEDPSTPRYRLNRAEQAVWTGDSEEAERIFLELNDPDVRNTLPEELAIRLHGLGGDLAMERDAFAQASMRYGRELMWLRRTLNPHPLLPIFGESDTMSVETILTNLQPSQLQWKDVEHFDDSALRPEPKQILADDANAWHLFAQLPDVELEFEELRVLVAETTPHDWVRKHKRIEYLVERYHGIAQEIAASIRQRPQWQIPPGQQADNRPVHYFYILALNFIHQGMQNHTENAPGVHRDMMRLIAMVESEPTLSSLVVGLSLRDVNKRVLEQALSGWQFQRPSLELIRKNMTDFAFKSESPELAVKNEYAQMQQFLRRLMAQAQPGQPVPGFEATFANFADKEAYDQLYEVRRLISTPGLRENPTPPTPSESAWMLYRSLRPTIHLTANPVYSKEESFIVMGQETCRALGKLVATANLPDTASIRASIDEIVSSETALMAAIDVSVFQLRNSRLPGALVEVSGEPFVDVFEEPLFFDPRDEIVVSRSVPEARTIIPRTTPGEVTATEPNRFR